MGLIKAAMGAVGGTLSDQWKELIYCDALEQDILVVKGQKKTSGRSSNTSGEDNIISNGSIIAVADGQCMIIIEQGEIIDVCSEPGEYVYDKSSEPSVFTGNLGESIKKVFATIGRRFTFGGDTGKDQRAYFFNIKEIVGNKYGTPTPIPFRVLDKNIGLDIDIAIRCNGEYSYKLVNPLLFYKNVCGNVESEYDRKNIDSMLKTELLTALQPAFARISKEGVRYSGLPGYTSEIADALNEILSEKWTQMRGIAIVSFGINTVSASKEDEDMIKQMQKNAVMRDPTMAAAVLTGAQAQAMQDAAKNEGQGAFMAFAGMNMANAAGGVNAENLFNMGKANKSANNWTCKCGHLNDGKFCAECGASNPSVGEWVCSCGTVNSGKFCTECAKPKASVATCSSCGWKAQSSEELPKFCPECGNKLKS